MRRDRGGRGRRHGTRAVRACALLWALRQRNLVSDQPGKAELRDPSLVNAWGLAFGPQPPHGSPTTAPTCPPCTPGSREHSGQKLGLTVSIPGGAPTGTVYNPSDGFVVHSGASSGPALSCSPPRRGRSPAGTRPSHHRRRRLMHSPPPTFQGRSSRASRSPTRRAARQIYATDFHNDKVDVWDANFAPGEAQGRLPRSQDSEALRSVWHRGRQRRHRRDLRQAGCGRRGRRGRPGQRVRRRL